jgi:hypothetical protein
MAYIQPQVQVFQEFSQLPQSVVANLNAFVFGPNYRLMRYAQASEKALIGLGAYDPDTDTAYDYPNQPSGSVIDLDYVKLYMEDVWALYATVSSASTTKLAAVSPAALNKLRAIPRVENTEEPATTDGVVLDASGYVYDSPSLPETLYVVPDGGDVGDAWSRMAASPVAVAAGHAWTAGDLAMTYRSESEGQTGTLSAPAADTPLTSGATVQGPYGVVFDMDVGTRAAGLVVYETDSQAGQPTSTDSITIAGQAFTFMTIPVDADYDVLIGATARATYDNLKAKVHAADLTDTYEIVHAYGATTATGNVWIIGDGAVGSTFAVAAAGGIDDADVYSEFEFAAVRQPTVLTFQNTAGTASFTMTVDPDTLGNSIDRAIDDSTPLRVTYSFASALASAFASATRICSIEIEESVTTLGELRAELVADSDIAAAFAIGELDANDADETVDLVVDETGSPVTADWTIQMIRDAYRTKVFPNDITWATGNGFSNSTHFKSRGVQVGDRVRYSVVGADSLTYEGSTQVAALEADTLSAKINPPTFDTNNNATQTGTELIPHTGADIVVAGADNVVACAGAKTKVYALSDSNLYYAGDYSAGALEDTYTITITHAGAAGTARCTVSTASGAYLRTLVPISTINWDDTDSDTMAMVDLGNNLWAVLHHTGVSLEFQLADTYTFSSAIATPWTAISSARLSVAGAYTGAVDTTYMLNVVRGGVFDRTSNVVDGLHNPNTLSIDYSGQVAQATDGDTVTVGGIVFEFDDDASVSGTNTRVDISASASIEADWTLMVASINASAAAVYASQDTTADSVTVRGSYVAVNGSSASHSDAGVEYRVYQLQLVSVVDFDAWSIGDADDEYVLRCTQAGTVANAQFTLESQRGDTQSLIEFAGTGVGNVETAGTAGLSLYFDNESETPTISVGDYWVVRVNATRPRVQITDTAGVDQGTYEVIDNGTSFHVGLYGIEATFASNPNTEGGFCPNGGLVTGDIFYVQADAAADGPIKTLVLADDLPTAVTTGLAIDDSGAVATYSSNYSPSLFTANLYLVQSAAEISAEKLQSPPDFNYVATSDDITVNDDIAVQDASWTELDGTMPYLPVYAGTMYAEYRALLGDYADAIYSLSDIGDVVTELGVVHPDNPLAQGVYNALLNSGDQSVYFMAVPTDDLAGYSAVLDQAAKTDVVYGFAPLTQDLTILAAVEAHINDLSGAENKRWRIGFVGTELPVETVVYDSTTFTPAGTAWLATVSDDPAVAGTQNTVVDLTNGTPTCVADVAVGDEVRLNFATDAWGAETYDTYEVARVVSNTKVILSTGTAAPITVAAKVELWRPNSTAQIATAVAARASAFGDRRIYHVFPGVAYADTTLQTSEFIAAAIAGLTSSVPPQQGLTNISVTGFTDLPSVYGTYTRDQLNEMAGSGAFILMQDMAGGEIYIRHQVSSATADGNLMTTELNVTKNLDAISYYFAEMLKPFIGRYNITPELLTVLRTQVKGGLNYMASDHTGAGLLGPMVVGGENTAIRSLEQHPTLQDQVVIVVDLQLPLPMNVIQLRLVV